MTPERARREEFLRQHGSFGEREKRERMVQGHELKSCIAYLKDHLERFAVDTSRRGVLLRKAWNEELLEKLELQRNLLRGKPIPSGRIRIHTNPARILQSLATGTRETAALTLELR